MAIRTAKCASDTDSVCSVNKLEQNQFANSTPGTRFSPSRFARIEPFCQRFNRSPYYSMVRTVSSGFDAEVKRPGRMILQFIKTLLQTQIRQYSLGEEEVKRPAFGILH